MIAVVVERFGRLDCACNVAGISVEPKPFVDHTRAERQRVIDVDLTGVFVCMQVELRQMLTQERGGAIVNVSSGAGVVPAPGQPHYTVVKHAVLGLTKQAAQEYVRIIIVRTRRCRARPKPSRCAGISTRSRTTARRLLRRMPMGRMARPNDIL